MHERFRNDPGRPAVQFAPQAVKGRRGQHDTLDRLVFANDSTGPLR